MFWKTIEGKRDDVLLFPLMGPDSAMTMDLNPWKQNEIRGKVIFWKTRNGKLLKEKEMMVFCSPLMELLAADSVLCLNPLKWNTGKANCGPQNPASWFINNVNNKSNNNNNFDNNNNNNVNPLKWNTGKANCGPQNPASWFINNHNNNKKQ